MFATKMLDATEGLSPSDPVPDDVLAAIGRSLTADEVREGLAALDELTRRRREVVVDGGSDAEAAGVHHAQKQVSAVLGRVQPDLLPVVAEGLSSPSTGVRFFTAGALLLAVDPSTLPAMRAARDVEPDRATRSVLDRAIEIAGPPKIPWRRRPRDK
jgi:hypothetical protein